MGRDVELDSTTLGRLSQAAIPLRPSHVGFVASNRQALFSLRGRHRLNPSVVSHSLPEEPGEEMYQYQSGIDSFAKAAAAAALSGTEEARKSAMEQSISKAAAAAATGVTA